MPVSRTNLWRKNPVLRLVLVQAAWGALLGLVFAAGLVAIDAHGLGRLMLGSDAGLVAFGLMAGGFMITFGSLVAGGAVMLMGDSENRADPPGGRRELTALVPIPVRVAVRRRPTR